jgi:large subunit ribosomal protein L10
LASEAEKTGIAQERRELMAKVDLKQPIVDEIKAKVDGATTVVLVDYRGLTVEQDTRLRKGLRQAVSTRYTKTH